MTQQEFKTIEGHVVILGWSDRVPRIIAQLRNSVHRRSNDLRPILVVVPHYDETIKVAFEQVYYLYGRLNDPAVLRHANVAKAQMVLIPTPMKNAAAEDGEAVFQMMAVLAINPEMRVCVELASAEDAAALDHIRCQSLKQGDIEIVSFEAVAEKLMAQATVNKGITRIYDHLLSFGEDSNEIYVSDLDERWLGKSFRTIAAECFDRGTILIGYERGGEMVLNPRDREVIVQRGDRVWYIAYNKAEGLEVLNPEALKS